MFPAPVVALLSLQGQKLREEERQLPVDDRPDGLRVDREVPMYHNVTESDDLSPGDLRMPFAKRHGDLRGRLADHFEVPQDRIEESGRPR